MAEAYVTVAGCCVDDADSLLYRNIEMSNTMTVKQACEHGRYDMHYYRGEKTERMNQPQPMDRCPGGKEITLRRPKVGEPGWADDTVWMVEADDE